MFCGYCGKENAEDYSFCAGCGKPLENGTPNQPIQSEEKSKDLDTSPPETQDAEGHMDSRLQSKYESVYWWKDCEWPWQARSVDEATILGNFEKQEDAADAVAKFHGLSSRVDLLLNRQRTESEREEKREALLKKVLEVSGNHELELKTEEHLSSYELPPSKVLSDTYESARSDIKSESESLNSAFEQLDSIQIGSPIEPDIPDEAESLSEEEYKEPFWIAYILSSTAVLSFWVLVLLKGEFDKRLFETGFFWEPHFLLLMAVLYHQTRKPVFGMLLFVILIIEKAGVVLTLGANGNFRGMPTIMLIAACVGFIEVIHSKNYILKGLLKIPAIILFITAFWSWASYHGYLGTMETFLPMLNLTGALGQAGNWLIVCIQGGLGYFLWELSKNKES